MKLVGFALVSTSIFLGLIACGIVMGIMTEGVNYQDGRHQHRIQQHRQQAMEYPHIRTGGER